MKNIELLAPAGSYEAFIAAIQNGANAVYLGGNDFSARAFATNFTNEEIVDAVRYAHLRNAKVFVTVNTLYQDDQFLKLYEYITFLYNNQVDALIIQDIGLLHMVKECFPDLEVHMSTQASIYNKETAQYYEKLGVDRIVLARENTIEEINEICTSTNLDVEVFVHGALCMGYSGQCLFSSFLTDRSGNKGSCSQPCRLPYRLTLNDKDISLKNTFLLSPKDLCTIEHVDKLIESGIHSFKIEGRMKRPEYVATIVKQYRLAIDTYLKRKSLDQTEMMIHKMKTMFNRGFTNGHIFSETDLLSGQFSGNKGLEIGKITGYSHKNKLLSIKLSQEIHQNDRILFHSKDLPRTITKLYYQGRLVNSGKPDQIVQIEMNQNIPIDEVVYRIYDIHEIKQANQSYQIETIKIPITMKFTVEDQYPVLCAEYSGIVVSYTSQSKIEKAIKTELSIDRIESQLKKLGNTIYTLKNVFIDFPTGYTFSIKELNEMRRIIIEKLSLKRLEVYPRKSKNDFMIVSKQKYQTDFQYVLKVTSLSQLKTVVNYSVEEIYCSMEEDINQAFTCFEEHNKKICFYTDFLTTSKTILNFINSGHIHKVHKVMVSDIRAYQLLKEHVTCVLDSNHNIYNSYALKHFNQNDVVLSKECSDIQIKNLNYSQSVYMYVYGFMEVMTLKHCVISNHYYQKKVVGCNACLKGQYSISDGKKTFKIKVDSSCNNHIYHYQPIYKKNIKELGVNYGILDFTFESDEEIINVLNEFSIY
ncbi:peptidase U32 family protein [Tannockella kyphosi]|uniref:peptidase U32 family protein n=1 Tax=Tannockella kyphosi TaxID=2899121 RepID=UPI002011BFED|nr:U32 family peptidase [Tannockella kyphosi]